MQSQSDFSKQLIKGKIAEMVFDEMFRRIHTYTVIPFGYEAIIPDLIQYTNQTGQNELIDNIRTAPDFALVKNSPKEVLLVEVKFRTRIDMDYIKENAKKICEKWKHVQLFVATPDGFYMDSCENIPTLSALTPLTYEVVPQDIQAEFLGLLKQFTQGSNAKE